MNLGDLGAVVITKSDGKLAWHSVRAGDLGPSGALREISAGAFASMGEQITTIRFDGIEIANQQNFTEVRFAIFPGTSNGSPRSDHDVQVAVEKVLYASGILK